MILHQFNHHSSGCSARDYRQSFVRFVMAFVLMSMLHTGLVAQQDSSLNNRYFRNLITDDYAITPFGMIQDTLFLNTLFFDPVRSSTPFNVVTGNPGAAHLDLIRQSVRSYGLSDGFNHFEGYLLSPAKSLPGEVIPSRFTRIDYHIASKREQHIMLNHEQHIRKYWFAGIDFGALSSPGDFSRQLNTNRNFRIWNAYESRKGTYRSYLSFTSNKINNQENGGITSDSVFENASSLDTRTLPVFLRNAESTLKTRTLFIKQELGLLKLFASRDTLVESGGFTTENLVLSHSLLYGRKSFLFESADPDSGYFTNFYLDSLETRDTVFFGQVTNELLLTYYSDSGKFNYHLSAGALMENNRFFYSGTEQDYNRVRGVVRLGWSIGNVESGILGSYHLNGDFDKTWDVAARLRFSVFSNNLKLDVGGSAGRYSHALKDYTYSSNHFRWNNGFDLLEQSSLYAGIYIPRWRTGITATGFIEKNRIFYREDFIPQSYENSVTFGRVSLINQLKFGKFKMDNRVDGSWSGNENVIRLPALAFYSSVYFNDILFKNALGFKVGADINYHSLHYNYGYMPATGIFYLQDEKQTGGYPLLGVFVNLQIKTASLFIRVDHLNAGIGERNYYGAYGYPLQGRTLKFGVNWSLTD